MQIMLIYDIPDTKIRTKIADICLDYGLTRIQYSAFTGNLARVHQEEMLGKMRKRLGKRPGKILLLPCCEKDWRTRLEIVQEAPTPATEKDGETPKEEKPPKP